MAHSMNNTPRHTYYIWLVGGCMRCNALAVMQCTQSRGHLLLPLSRNAGLHHHGNVYTYIFPPPQLLQPSRLSRTSTWRERYMADINEYNEAGSATSTSWIFPDPLLPATGAHIEQFGENGYNQAGMAGGAGGTFLTWTLMWAFFCNVM